MIKNTIKKFIAFKPKQYSQHCNSLYFIHIPKTAGTSFREALERSFHVYKDYGEDSKQTSPVIKQYLYDEDDLYSLKKKVLEKNSFCLTGHTSMMKYISFVPIEHTVTFIRKPVEQLLSHYNHFVMLHDYKGELAEFLKKPMNKNLQSRCLQGLPLGLIGYIGLTEKYDESIDIINQQYGLSLGRKKYNVNKSRALIGNELEQHLNERFLEKNKQDIEMYEEAKFLHEQRVNLSKEAKPWTYGYAVISPHNKLHGCAYRYQSDVPVTLLVNINGKPFKTIIAKEFCGLFVRANFPRERYVGFNIALSKYINSEDVIDIYVEETGQKLNFKPLKQRSK